MRLHFKAIHTKWNSEEELEMLAMEGMFWAAKIFQAIQFLARRCKETFGSFLWDKSNRLIHAYQMVDVVDTCERCLERLVPEVFFGEKATTASSGMTQPSLLLTISSVVMVPNANSVFRELGHNRNPNRL